MPMADVYAPEGDVKEKRREEKEDMIEDFE